MDAYEQAQADKSAYARIRCEQCEAFVTEIRRLRKEYYAGSIASDSQGEFRRGTAYLGVVEDLDAALALIGEASDG
ncbi:MAG: hypothetical protein M0R06_15500 [Sphaerochaeta sp.]|jgi:hypothetical protein|nr:hypothetical protein [Sphaerochaeta sp.]